MGGCAPVWRGAAGVIAVMAFIATPASAFAFQIETSGTSACHETITREALDVVGWPDGREPPPLDDTGQRIADDLPFDLPDDEKDLWTIALIIGVRHNDVGSNDPFDLPALSQLHGDPAGQPEHCLRQAPHDGATGDQQALDACADFVIDQLEQALAAGDGGEVDMDATVKVETHLLFRGKVEIDLPAYPFHVGRALHALQDSYAHQFRDPADERVRSVLNWVEGNLEGDSDEMRDGHPHRVDDGRVRQQRRRQAAPRLGSAGLGRSARRAGQRPGRARRPRRPGARRASRPTPRSSRAATSTNDYCDTREATLPAGCSAAGSAQLGGPGWLLAALALLALGRAAVQRASGRRRVAALAVAVALLTPVAAGAQEEGSDEPSATSRALTSGRARRRRPATRTRSSRSPARSASSTGYRIRWARRGARPSAWRPPSIAARARRRSACAGTRGAISASASTSSTTRGSRCLASRSRRARPACTCRSSGG